MTHNALANITKVYTAPSDDEWANTAMVRHDGVVIAFVQSASGEIRPHRSLTGFSHPPFFKEVTGKVSLSVCTFILAGSYRRFP